MTVIERHESELLNEYMNLESETCFECVNVFSGVITNYSLYRELRTSSTEDIVVNGNGNWPSSSSSRLATTATLFLLQTLEILHELLPDLDVVLEERH